MAVVHVPVEAVTWLGEHVVDLRVTGGVFAHQDRLGRAGDAGRVRGEPDPDEFVLGVAEGRHVEGPGEEQGHCFRVPEADLGA